MSKEWPGLDLERLRLKGLRMKRVHGLQGVCFVCCEFCLGAEKKKKVQKMNLQSLGWVNLRIPFAEERGPLL